MGNGKDLADAETAFSELLGREFSGISFEDGKQERIVFAPPVYIHPRSDLPAPGTPQFEVFMERHNKAKEQLETIEAKEKADRDLQSLYDGYNGYAFEARVFEAFKDLLLSEHKDPGKKNVTLLQVKV